MSPQLNGKGVARLAIVSVALLLVAATALVVGRAALDATAAGASDMDAIMTGILQGMWSKPTAGWETRLVQDENQKACSRYRNNPPAAEAKAISAREVATIEYPADGKVLGDWKEGEKIASSGKGGQFSDPPNTVNGGNCYACHQLAPHELSYGTIGSSLYQFGKLRGNSAEIQQYTFGKIFNSNAYSACSNMPRYGHNGILTEQQIMHVVALLLDPDSPVNK